MKKISIIIYNLNNVTNLLVTIKSLILNEYVNKEILIVDEFQTKEEELNEIIRKHNIKMFNSNQIIGMFNMINLGIKNCNGEYILLGTSNITYNSKILINLSNYFEAGNDVLEFNTDACFEHDFVKIAFTKKIIDDIGYFDTYDLYSDWDFKFRINKVFTIKTIKLNYIHQSSDKFNNPSQAVVFKNYFSNIKNRIYIPYKNYLKYDNIVFDKLVYSNSDIIVSFAEHNKLINCTQYIKINTENKYRFVNISEKKNITIFDNDNAYKLSNNFFYFKKGYYIIRYSVNQDVISVDPITIAFYDQVI